MLIILLRYPEPGRAKTRLIAAIGAVAAADLQHEMSVRTLATARQFAQGANHGIEVRFTGGTLGQMSTLYGADLQYREQGEGDLGHRLSLAIAEGLRSGARTVVVIGTDCPALTVDHLYAANEALGESDLVLGPALDGGYYLIGLSQPHSELFEGIDWSTERVLSQTMQAAHRLGLSVRLLAPLADVDRPEDLPQVPTS
jgi:rSAM/selenodomain-associated transferase 1